jgi:hypothetical protein
VQSSSSSYLRQTMFRWLNHPQQENKMYWPLHCSKKQDSQNRLPM